MWSTLRASVGNQSENHNRLIGNSYQLIIEYNQFSAFSTQYVLIEIEFSNIQLQINSKVVLIQHRLLHRILGFIISG